MTITLYSATGCIRCRLVRQLLKDRDLTYPDYDALVEGKDAFRSFYQANRQKIYRGPDGVEFPIMEVQGALDLHSLLLPQPVEPTEIEKTIRTVSTFSQYHFVTTIAPIERQPGNPPEISYVTPEEVAQAAKLIETAAGDNRQPYRLRFTEPKNAKDRRLRTWEALAPGERFKYRNQARKHQFKTEILKLPS